MRDMKDSGIEWIGEIPKDWKFIKCKYLFDIGLGLTHTPKYVDEGIPFISVKDISSGYLDKSNMKYISKDEYKLFPAGAIPHKGDILFGRVATLGSPVILDEEIELGMFVSMGKLTNINRSKVITEYMKYWMESSLFTNELYKFVNGSAQINLNTTWLKRFNILLPPIKDQINIVKYLNIRCSEIDSLHSDIQKQIETLEEYKKSVITEAVTKGLNPNVEMKNSGIKWIGKIPIQWKCCKLGYFTFVTKLAGFEFTDYFDYSSGGNVIAIRGLNLKNINIDITDIQTISEHISDLLPRSQIKVNDILISYAGSVGNIGILEDSKKRYHLAPNVGKIEVISKNLLPKYIAYFLISNAGQEEIYQLKNKNAQESISMENIRKIKILLPKYEEQEAIVEYLEKKCAEIDGAINNKKQQLETLEQYKKSLIYEYVTGKKEVSEDE